MPSWVWILVFLLLLALLLVGVLWLTGTFAAAHRRGVEAVGRDGAHDDVDARTTDGGGDSPTPSRARSVPIKPRRRTSRPPPALAGPVASDGQTTYGSPAPADSAVAPQPRGGSVAGSAAPKRSRRGVPPAAAAAWSASDDKAR